MDELLDTDTTGSLREAVGGGIHVTLIRAGTSLNGNYYPDATLREAVPLFEGVRVFAKSDADHSAGRGKDVRNLIGGIYSVRFVEGAPGSPDTGALVGTFRPLLADDPVVVKMTEAVKAGMQGLMGLSIDATASIKRRQAGGKTLREATRFIVVNSVDLIVEPGAGGGLDRLTESAPETPSTPENITMPEWKKRLLAAIQRKSPTEYAKVDAANITDDEVFALHESVMTAAPAPETTRVIEAATEAPVTRAELEMLRVHAQADRLIVASTLPKAGKERLQAQFGGMARFTEADVSAAITAEAGYLARLTESGAVRVPAFGPGSVSVEDRSVVLADMLDAFFDPSHKNHRSVHSFKECYVEMTGDRRLTGQIADCDRSRLAESAGGDFRESLVSTTWANALGNSMTRRMMQVYTGQVALDAWREVANVTSVNDFRTQERLRIGGYGNLPGVAEGGSYTALATPGDAKATYSASKRGGTESVTLETVINDDVQAVRRIPTELALAAKYTLYEFVFDFYATNPVIYDGAALYHASHGNLFTGALSAAEFSAHRMAMIKMTRAGSGKRLGTTPAKLIIPFELQETAENLFVRNQNLDKTFVQSLNPKIIPVAHWTDPSDWCTVADPMVMPVLELGFLNGQEEPELFVQDMPNVGSLFNNDTLTYKIRHIYGGGILVDAFKATTKAVVA